MDGKCPASESLTYFEPEDPFGHHWSVGTHVRDVSMEEMRQAMQKQSA